MFLSEKVIFARLMSYFVKLFSTGYILNLTPSVIIKKKQKLDFDQ